MKKKLSPHSALQISVEPKLLCITSVKPEIVATFNEVPIEFMTRMKLKETLDRSHKRHDANKRRHQRDHHHQHQNRGHERMNDSSLHVDVTQLSDESDLADSPAAESIQSSYTSPIFQELAETNPCPVDGCPLNPSVRFIFELNITICLKWGLFSVAVE